MAEPDTALFGRVLHIPRAVFARHIQLGNSKEPPNGEYWEARITGHNPSHTHFDIVPRTRVCRGPFSPANPAEEEGRSARQLGAQQLDVRCEVCTVRLG